jgi:hypothetical protein
MPGINGHNNAQQPAPRKPAGARSLIQVAFPQQATAVFYSAIIVGLILVASTTVFRLHFALNGTQSNLVLCVGTALVLAAFGGQATVRSGTLIVAGVAAIALGLFVYLQHVSESLFLKGTVYNFNYDKYQTLDMTLTNRVLGGINQNRDNLQRSRYEFVLFKAEVDSQFIEVNLVRRNGNGEQHIEIDVADIQWAFGDRRRLEWELREADGDEEKILTIFERNRNKEIARERVVGVQRAAKRIPIAFASPVFAATVPAQPDVAKMLERLKSDDQATRRDARAALAKAPIGSLPQIMQTFREQSSDYRVKLGVCVVLAELLRADKTLAPKITKLLSKDDVALVVDAVGDPDRTVRVYAAEFLVGLRDSRATMLAVERAAVATSDNTRYNWLLVAQAGWSNLTDQQKGGLREPLHKAQQQSGPKTTVLFDKLK